jgi:general secretion pathway protein J
LKKREFIVKLFRKTGSSAGFTLFEVFIAIFIFAIIITTILGSYRAVFSTVDAVYEGMEMYEMARNCLNRMITDLNAIYIVRSPIYAKPEFNDDPDPHRIVGDAASSGGESFSRLRFTSAAHVRLGGDNRTGIAEIVYYVHMTKDQTYVLRRSDRLFYDTPFEENSGDPVLSEHIKSVSYTFYDDEDNEYEYWDSESDEFDYSTPRALKIRIEIGNNFSSFFYETMITFPIFREKLK